MPKFQTCPSCSAQQELPAIFCSTCGAPLIKISKWFLSTFLSITVIAYVIFGLYAQTLLWPAPLYTYYVLLFVVFSLTVTRRYRVVTLRVLVWSSVVLLYAMWFFWLSIPEGLRIVTSDARDLINFLERSTPGQWVAGLLVVSAFIAAFVALVRRFGFLVGYRLYFSLLAAVAYGVRWGVTYSIGETSVPVSPRLSDWFTWMPEKEVLELIELVAVGLLRALAAEMCVTCFYKCIKPAAERFQQLEVKAGLDAQARSKLQMRNPLMDAMTRLASAGLRTGVVLQFFLIKLAEAMRDYLWALYRVVRRITIDYLLPMASLCASAYILSLLSEHSGAYITGKSPRPLVFFHGIRSSTAMILLLLVLVFVTQMVFLACVTKFGARALWRCNTLLVLWIAPFFFALFFFVSVSLIVTGFMLKRWDNDTFPYHMGPMTMGSAVILAVLAGYAAFQWKRLQKRSQREAAQQPADSAPESALSAESPAQASPETHE